MQKVIIGVAPNITVEISEDSVQKVVKQAAFWGQLPSTCPVCQTPLVFFHRTPQDNEYYGLACTGTPIHESNFGQYKKTELGFYYKGDWQEAYAAYQNEARGQGDDERPTYGSRNPEDAPAQTYAPAAANDPVARSLGDMITAKQLGMIRAIAREANINENAECSSLMHCDIDQLSKRAASDFIDHLQNLQRNNVGEGPTAPEVRRAPDPAPANPQPPVRAAAPAPVATPATQVVHQAPASHPPECNCSQCDIPF